jgi:polar amino acid transport system permease protein
MGYDWNFSIFLPYTGAFARGLLVSIELTLISSIAGTLLGALLAIPLRWRLLGPVLGIINDILRAIPLLVLMFFFYYFPSRELFGWSPMTAFWSAASALTLTQLNFTAEIVRGAIDGVPARLVTGARALGLKETPIWVNVIAPHVTRQTLPTLIAFYITNLKLSSLASVIGADDIVYVARLAVSQTFRSLEVWVLVGCIYIAMVVPCTILARQLERSSWMMRR